MQKVITCDRITGIERPVMDGPTVGSTTTTTTTTTTATTPTAAHRYSKDQVRLSVDRLKSDLNYQVQARIQPVSLSKLSPEELKSKFSKEPFKFKLLLVSTILMLARIDMSPEEEAFARIQDTRVQRLHDMYMARGARTDEQNKYFKDVVRDGLFDGWLKFICAVIRVLE
ncbi:hypothetical protein AA0118_g2208 [Alternaria tenuissima]|nr:hypothetical protein AA0118_g2208 [Alternaria tenuissima]